MHIVFEAELFPQLTDVTRFSRRGLSGENKIGSNNDFAPTRRQAIIWAIIHKLTDARMRHSASMRLNWDHDGVIKWNHVPRYWTFVWEIQRWPVNSPHKGQWRGAFMFSSICAWINGWVNNCEAGDLRRHRAKCDVTVMCFGWTTYFINLSMLSCQTPLTMFWFTFGGGLGTLWVDQVLN